MPLPHIKKVSTFSEKIKQQDALIHHLLEEKAALTAKLSEEMKKRDYIEAENRRLSQHIAQLTELKKSLCVLEEEKKNLLFKLNAQKKLTQALIEGFEQTKRAQQNEIETLEKEVAMLKTTQESSGSFRKSKSKRAYSLFTETTMPSPPKTPQTRSFRRQ